MKDETGNIFAKFGPVVKESHYSELVRSQLTRQIC